MGSWAGFPLLHSEVPSVRYVVTLLVLTLGLVAQLQNLEVIGVKVKKPGQLILGDLPVNADDSAGKKKETKQFSNCKSSCSNYHTAVLYDRRPSGGSTFGGTLHGTRKYAFSLCHNYMLPCYYRANCSNCHSCIYHKLLHTLFRSPSYMLDPRRPECSALQGLRPTRPQQGQNSHVERQPWLIGLSVVCVCSN